MRSEKQIIGIGGLIGAGKSTVAKIISENRDWELLSFGKMIEEIVLAEGREPNRKNKQDKGLEIINEKGYKGIAQLLLDHYQFKEINSYVIEGIRHPEVIKFYRDIFKVSFQFLFIDCPWEIRVERISKKQFKDKNEYDNDLKSIEEIGRASCRERV